jgi:hypothetical protein
MTEDTFTKLYGEDAFDRPENWTDGTFKPKRITRDSAPGQRRGGFVRGYQTLDAESAPRTVQDDAADAYEAKRARLHTDAATPTSTGDADQAYRERSDRLQNAWKEKSNGKA